MKLWASQWKRYSARKLLGVRDAGRVTPYNDLGSDKSWEKDCWGNCSVGNLFREIVARQVVAGRVAPYVEPSSDKAMGESLGE
jgi:hypothetical protein